MQERTVCNSKLGGIGLMGVGIAVVGEELGGGPRVEVVPAPVYLQVKAGSISFSHQRAGEDDLYITLQRGQRIGLLGSKEQGWGGLLSILLGEGTHQADQLKLNGEWIDSDHLAYRCQRGAALHRGPWQSRQTVVSMLVGLGMAQGLSPQEAHIRCNQLLRFVEQSHVGKVALCQLTAGERRWVSFAQALLLKPTLLLCEQPTLGMDEQEQRRFWRCLDLIEQHHSMAVVIFAEEGREVAGCDEVVMLHQGGTRTPGAKSHWADGHIFPPFLPQPLSSRPSPGQPSFATTSSAKDVIAACGG